MYVCREPGFVTRGIGLGPGTWDVGVLCALHYTIDARNTGEGWDGRSS